MFPWWSRGECEVRSSDRSIFQVFHLLNVSLHSCCRISSEVLQALRTAGLRAADADVVLSAFLGQEAEASLKVFEKEEKEDEEKKVSYSESRSEAATCSAATCYCAISNAVNTTST